MKKYSQLEKSLEIIHDSQLCEKLFKKIQNHFMNNANYIIETDALFNGQEGKIAIFVTKQNDYYENSDDELENLIVYSNIYAKKSITGNIEYSCFKNFRYKNKGFGLLICYNDDKLLDIAVKYSQELAEKCPIYAQKETIKGKFMSSKVIPPPDED